MTLRGLSIATLVARSGQSAQRVQVVKRNGGSTIVTPANFATALLSDDGVTTRYIRSSGGVLVDYIESSDIKLEVSVDGGDLVIRAKANRKRVKVGESVTFEAGVFQGPPGANYSFEWDFGDPSGPVTGKRVPYRPELAGVLFAQVAVSEPRSGLHDSLQRHRSGRGRGRRGARAARCHHRGRRQRHARRRGLLGRQRRRRVRRRRRRRGRGGHQPRR